jgi:alcohol dehydrogenase/propanol-preferring alcohol dehydrogenase
MMMMRVVEIAEPGAPFELRERPIPDPGLGEVRVRVEACGVCHSDAFARSGGYPGARYPLVPGHEVAGAIDAVGAGVKGWAEGDRVGVGWFGGNCTWCEPCRRGQLIDCANMPVTGITVDGGYADYMLAPAAALALIPDGLGAAEAAPLMCAGITTFNALRRSGARAGSLVAVLGIGGLGHLGVQYAVRLGYETVAIARGTDKEELARTLGAHHYIDSEATDVAGALTELGGAQAVLATATNGPAVSKALGGLGPSGTLVVVGAAPEPLAVPAGLLIGGGKGVRGHASGTSIDSQDTLEFSLRHGVAAMIETLPLERVDEAYERMMSGRARFRMVLTMAA